MKKHSNVILFEDRDLFGRKRPGTGDEPVHVLKNETTGTLTEYYSTGKLEFALQAGLKPYIVSIMPLSPQYMDWISALLPPSQILMTEGLFDGIEHLITGTGPQFAVGSVEMLKRVHGPWRKLYAALGVAWLENTENPQHLRAHLIDVHGVRDGRKFCGLADN